MKNIYVIVTAAILATFYNFAGAAPVDGGPPAQQQKNIPPSESHGDYLEPQPDENGVNTNTQTQDKKATKQSKKWNKDAQKPSAAVKGKNQTEQPDSGGVNVN